MKKLVMILGMHRSGTSVLTHICQCMGAYLGEERELLAATEGNPDGHYENAEIVRLDDVILRMCGREWYSLEAPEPDFGNAQIKNSMKKIREILQKLFETHDLIAVKDPRIALLLPVWEQILKQTGIEVKYIWVFRNPLEVAESLTKRDGYSRKHGLLLWIRYNLCILQFLKGKEYQRIQYEDLLESQEIYEKLSCTLGRGRSDPLSGEWNRIVKRGYRHSARSVQDVLDQQMDLLSDLYMALLEGREQKDDGVAWEKRYKKEIDSLRTPFIDNMVLQNPDCLKGKEIVIYGAGKYGKRAAKILQDMGYTRFDFCDRDPAKRGMKMMGKRVLSIGEIEQRENLLIVIAAGAEYFRKEIEQTLLCMKKVVLLSFLALEQSWKYIEGYYKNNPYMDHFYSKEQ